MQVAEYLAPLMGSIMQAMLTWFSLLSTCLQPIAGRLFHVHLQLLWQGAVLLTRNSNLHGDLEGDGHHDQRICPPIPTGTVASEPRRMLPHQKLKMLQDLLKSPIQISLRLYPPPPSPGFWHPPVPHARSICHAEVELALIRAQGSRSLPKYSGNCR